MGFVTTEQQLTTHFKSAEFRCTCGCKAIKIDAEFVQRLEKLYSKIDSLSCGCSAIYVSSGYRCDKDTARIQGAFKGDMHNIGAAADICAYDSKHELIDSKTLCEAAQLCGFGGIALIDAAYIHVDDRQRSVFNYANRQWYGNEMTGENYMTFIGKSRYTAELNSVQPAQKKQIKVKIIIDDHEYSGLLE